MSDLYVEFKALEKTIGHSHSMKQLEGTMQFNLRARDAVSVKKRANVCGGCEAHDD